MVDFSSLLPAGLPANPALLPTLLDLLPLGVMYYTPVLDAAGTLTDLALAYLNPAAQRMTQLPARPGTTYRQQFPTTDANGAWDFHRRTWLGQEPGHFQFYYDVDGFDSYFRVTAQRLGEGLLTIFTDTQDEVRSQAELALLASQARERAALAEAERQRGELARVFESAPVAIAVYQGPEYRIELANPVSCQLLNRTADELLGRPLFEAMPELADHGFEQVLASVYTTGQPVLVQEQPGTHARAGQLDTLYWNLAFVPMRAPDGQIIGALSAGLDVTEQVLARQQVQNLNEKLAAINEELRTTNDEYQRANIALSESQQQLWQFNQELEARVQQRTQVAEQAQALAERQRRSVIELVQQAPAALCIVAGPDFVYETFNPLYAEMFGGRPRVGRPMGEVLPEVVNHPSFLAFRAVYEHGRTFRQSEVLVPLARPGDGVLEDHYFSYTQQPRYDSQGQIDGVFVFAVEVTEQVLARRQVEQLNHELEARVAERTQQVEAAQAATERERAQLQALIAQAPVAIALFEGDDLRVTSANTAIAALWGYPPAQVVGRPLLEGVPELQGQGFDNLLRQVLHTQVPVTGTETPAVLLRDGQPQTSYYNFVYQPLYDAEGQVLGVLDVAVEVTEQVLARQQVEQLNQELEARVQARTRELQNLFAQAPMALVVLRGPQFIIEQANAQAGHIWGVAVADVLGRPHFEAVPGSAGQGFEQMLTGVLHSGEAVVLREVLIKLARAHTGQPSEGYYNVIFKPLFDEGQPQATGIVVMWTETTDQVMARQQVQELNEELAAMNEELTVTNEELNDSNTQLTRTNVDLDNFIYTASHDLKAPITNIEGLLLALEHELPTADRPGDVSLMLTMMQDAIDRFRRTINHLTDLSRLQKEHNPDANAVTLAPVVEAVRLDLTPLLTHTQGQLTVIIPEGLTVTFAEKNLRSVVYNLLSNAFKYHHPDRRPEVQLRSWLAGEYAVLEVQDNGLGLDLSQGQERLFAMFQRLHTHVEGTGVGLYMVKRILENAGGRIEVSSELGQGTTFHVYFRR